MYTSNTFGISRDPRPQGGGTCLSGCRKIARLSAAAGECDKNNVLAEPTPHLQAGPGTPPQGAGPDSFIETPKHFPNAIEVVAVDLANLGMQAAVIDRPDLI